MCSFICVQSKNACWNSVSCTCKSNSWCQGKKHCMQHNFTFLIQHQTIFKKDALNPNKTIQNNIILFLLCPSLAWSQGRKVLFWFRGHPIIECDRLLLSSGECRRVSYLCRSSAGPGTTTTPPGSSCSSPFSCLSLPCSGVLTRVRRGWRGKHSSSSCTSPTTVTYLLILLKTANIPLTYHYTCRIIL